jgi:glycosyltransferase involved in cell wall biosynthesis
MFSFAEPRTGSGDTIVKVALDSWVLQKSRKHSGIYTYAEQLFSRFRELAQHEPALQFAVLAPPRNGSQMFIPGPHFEISETDWFNRDRFWRFAGAGITASRVKADVAFSPSFNTLPVGGIPWVCTIHDVTPIRMPAHSPAMLFMMKRFLWAAAKLSRAIITDSQHSKEDVVEIYRVPTDKVRVVYLGYDQGTFNSNPADEKNTLAQLNRLGVSRPYILHHGVVQPRKNLARLIEAYRLLLSRNKSLDFDLVLAGPMGWLYDEIIKVAENPDPGPRGRVIFTGALEDRQLAILIKGAALSVVPSLYEGFCLPMVESMACGTPTIVSNASCLPEVSGGVLRYFDPTSVDAMANCMQEVLESKDLQIQLAIKGIQRASEFDWMKCAKETLAFIKEVGNG